jgi:hypothetical protein
MKTILNYFLGILAVISIAFFWFFMILLGNRLAENLPKHGVWYDCSVSEISPDFPNEVREQCRRMRMNRT